MPTTAPIRPTPAPVNEPFALAALARGQEPVSTALVKVGPEMNRLTADVGKQLAVITQGRAPVTVDTAPTIAQQIDAACRKVNRSLLFFPFGGCFLTLVSGTNAYTGIGLLAGFGAAMGVAVTGLVASAIAARQKGQSNDTLLTTECLRPLLASVAKEGPEERAVMTEAVDQWLVAHQPFHLSADAADELRRLRTEKVEALAVPVPTDDKVLAVINGALRQS